MADTPHAPADLPAIAYVLDALPVSLIIYDLDGLVVSMNQAAARLWRVDRAVVIGRFNFLTDEQSVEQGSRELFQRVRAGEVVVRPPIRYDTEQLDAELTRSVGMQIWTEATAFSLRDAAGIITHVGMIHQDVTERIEQSQLMAAAQAEISDQRSAILALSSPVIQVWDEILTLPLIGQIDSRRAQVIIEGLLTAIVEHQARYVIVDITGVAMIDTLVASYIISAARAAQLLGSQVVLSGISPEIAQTLVQIGFDSAQLVTHANLKTSIVWAFAQLGLRVERTAPAARSPVA
jgi:rsbT co-antagonist protein RsbR